MSKAATEAASNLSSAEEKLEDGATAAALEDAEKALSLFKEAGDAAGTADALRAVVKSQSSFEEAEKLAMQELAKFKTAGDARGQASMHLALAEFGGDKKTSKERTKAERQGSKAVTCARKASDKVLEATALTELATLAYFEGEPEEVFSKSTEAMTLAQSLGDKKLEAQALHGLGLASYLVGDADEALQKAEDALTIFQDLKLKGKEAAELCAIAQVYLMQGKPSAALSRAFDALAAKKGTMQTALVVEALIAAGRATEGVKPAQDAVEQAAGDSKSEALALQILAKAQLAADSPDEALKACEKALAAARAAKDRSQEYQILNSMSVAYVAAKKMTQAATPLQEAVEISSDLGLVSEQAQATVALGELYLDTKQFEKALSASTDAAKLFQDEGDRNGEGSAMALEANCYMAQGETTKALASAKVAYELFFVAGDFFREAKMLQLMAELAMAGGETDEALKYANKAVDALKDAGDTKAHASVVRTLAAMYLQQGSLPEAEGWAAEAKRLSSTVADDEGEAAANIVLSNVHVMYYEQEPRGGDAYLTSEALGKLSEATREATSCAARSGNVALQAAAALWRGHYLMWSSQPPTDEAMTNATKAASLFKKAGDSEGETAALVLQAYLHLAAGRREQARASAGDALESAKRTGDAMGEQQASAALDFFEREEMQAAMAMSGGAARGGGRPGRAGAPGADALAASGGGGGGGNPGLDPVMVRSKLMDLVREAMATDDELLGDNPLMESGLDSLSATDLTSQIAREFRISIGPSLVFDYPTVREITLHLVEESKS
jgi:tetratricopeptide (TPR) repeat protein